VLYKEYNIYSACYINSLLNFFFSSRPIAIATAIYDASFIVEGAVRGRVEGATARDKGNSTIYDTTRVGGEDNRRAQRAQVDIGERGGRHDRASTGRILADKKQVAAQGSSTAPTPSAQQI